MVLRKPTRPVVQLKHHWDTEQDASGRPSQVVVFSSEGIGGTRFGHQGYHPVSLEGKPAEVMAFQQIGERWAFAIDGKLYQDVDGKAAELGAVELRSYRSETGQERRALMTRRSGRGPWWFEADGRVFEEDARGKVSQVGWMEWRIVSAPEGEALVVMTRGMGSGDSWSGRREGVVYVDKP